MLGACCGRAGELGGGACWGALLERLRRALQDRPALTGRPALAGRQSLQDGWLVSRHFPQGVCVYVSRRGRLWEGRIPSLVGPVWRQVVGRENSIFGRARLEAGPEGPGGPFGGRPARATGPEGPIAVTASLGRAHLRGRLGRGGVLYGKLTWKLA
eukprot:229355-Chlamydomonas_euryale.AAC.2